MQAWEVILIMYVFVNIFILLRTGVPDGQPGDHGAYVIAVLIMGAPVYIAFKVNARARRRKSLTH